MAMIPERVKYRKMHRGNRAGMATRGHTVAFGEYGLMALQRCWLDTKQLEAARVASEQTLEKAREQAGMDQSALRGAPPAFRDAIERISGRSQQTSENASRGAITH